MSITHLLPSEQQADLLAAKDEEVQAWLVAAQAGDTAAWEQLRQWAYLTAQRYYENKLTVERALTPHDAEQLATRFFLEFERTWRRVRQVTHFTRRVLKNNLRRYLQKKHQRTEREVALAPEQLSALGEADQAPDNEPDWQGWGDDEWHQYRVTLQTLHTLDATTQQIVTWRFGDPPMAYAEISERLEMTEASIRMRVARFYRAVRDKYEETFKIKKSRYEP